MDLLGSILNSMDKPPSFSNQHKQMIQKQKKQMEKEQAKEKAMLKKFREKTEAKINEFIQGPSQQKYRFDVMEKVYRTIVHDVAEVAGLSAFSFGEDGVDRYVMIFKKEFAPSDEELAAYRRGEEWDPQKAKELAHLKEQEKLQEVQESKKRKIDCVPSSNYKDKYEKLLGRDAGIAAAKLAIPNKQFGFVPSEQKKDQRSIEQTLADIRAKKRQKIEADATTTHPDSKSDENGA